MNELKTRLEIFGKQLDTAKEAIRACADEIANKKISALQKLNIEVAKRVISSNEVDIMLGLYLLKKHKKPTNFNLVRTEENKDKYISTKQYKLRKQQEYGNKCIYGLFEAHYQNRSYPLEINVKGNDLLLKMREGNSQIYSAPLSDFKDADKVKKLISLYKKTTSKLKKDDGMKFIIEDSRIEINDRYNLNIRIFTGDNSPTDMERGYLSNDYKELLNELYDIELFDREVGNINRAMKSELNSRELARKDYDEFMKPFLTKLALTEAKA